jgi:predicted RNase H-like HicB family nuclease
VKLHILIEQDEDGFFVAEVPALPGCLSQGKTEDEARSNIKEAVEGWLEVMEAKQKIDPDRLTEVSV